jgi:hypothetical protein
VAAITPWVVLRTNRPGDVHHVHGFMRDQNSTVPRRSTPAEGYFFSARGLRQMIACTATSKTLSNSSFSILKDLLFRYHLALGANTGRCLFKFAGGGALRTSRTDPAPYKHRTTHGPTDGPNIVRRRTILYDTAKHRTTPQNTAKHRTDVRSTVRKSLLLTTPGHHTTPYMALPS